MKKGIIVLITVVTEAIALWLVARLFGWALIDTMFLGGLAIFGCVWMSRLYFNQTNNEFNAYTRGWTGQDSGGIKQFHFIMSPIILGIVIFLVISLFITIMTYYPYFIG